MSHTTEQQDSIDGSDLVSALLYIVGSSLVISHFIGYIFELWGETSAVWWIGVSVLTVQAIGWAYLWVR